MRARGALAGAGCWVAASLLGNLARPLCAVLEVREWARENPGMVSGGAALEAVLEALAQESVGPVP